MDQRLSALAAALHGNTTLTALNLNSNRFGAAAGPAALAAAVRAVSGLRSLQMSFSEIGDAGASALAESLQGNATLTALWLCRNGIGDEGASALAVFLEGNTTLKVLDLQLNGVISEAQRSSISAAGPRGLKIIWP